VKANAPQVLGFKYAHCNGEFGSRRAMDCRHRHNTTVGTPYADPRSYKSLSFTRHADMSTWILRQHDAATLVVADDEICAPLDLSEPPGSCTPPTPPVEASSSQSPPPPSPPPVRQRAMAQPVSIPNHDSDAGNRQWSICCVAWYCLVCSGIASVFSLCYNRHRIQVLRLRPCDRLVSTWKRTTIL